MNCVLGELAVDLPSGMEFPCLHAQEVFLMNAPADRFF